ncbi:MAG TPA: class I SAM-dependent methyltransferase [Pyrinomonadaceae bacterium]|nr:class I SAM-dependent methyltransferase [Pyrinomonadaceae bacterium]
MSPDRPFLPAAGHDLFLPLYDPLVTLLGGNRSRQELIEQANMTSGQRILDIGCGTGSFAVLLKRQRADVEIVGLDPDPKALRRAKAKATRAGVSVQFDQGFSDELRYESKSFDRVFSSLMFHHLDEQTQQKTLREVLRVLKPGGSFHLLDFARSDSSHTSASHESSSPHSHGLHSHLMQLFHPRDRVQDNSDAGILVLMTGAGFANVEKVKDGRMLFGLLRTVYYRATV